MPKHILILTDAFVPPMQGTRMRNLSRNLLRAGYDCRLVCEQTDQTILPDTIPTTPFRYYPPACSKTKRLLLYLLDKLFNLKEKRFTRFVKNNIDLSQIDLIIASAYIFPLASVGQIAQLCHCPYIIDLRDIFEQWDSTLFINHPTRSPLLKVAQQLYIRRKTKERNLLLEKAKAVTTISEWHRQQLLPHNPSTHLIYNGFDALQFAFRQVSTPKFTITYTGKLYSLQLRNPELLFQALRQLIDQQLIDQQKISIVFYIEDEMHPVIRQMADRYQLGHLLDCRSFVSSEQIPHILANTSVSLLLNKADSADPIHGVLPTKLFEAIGAEKPVLAIPADHDCLQQLIEEHHLGLAAQDTNETALFLLDYYHQWLRNGYTRLTAPDRDAFSRQQQAQQFIRLINS